MIEKSKRAYYGGGRKATGTLEPTKTGEWVARYWAIEDGEKVRKRVSLGTQSKAAARAKLKRLLASGAPITKDAAAGETFADAAERVHEARKVTVAHADIEIASLRRFVFPEIGKLDVSKVTTQHVNSVLDAVKVAGKSKQTAQHIKQRMANVFAQLKREGSIQANPVDEAELPKFASTVRKERAVLRDSELEIYLRWQHPDERFRMAVLERQTMSCVARMFGGLRTGDLHALDWKALKVENDEFVEGYAPRQKTRRPQLLEVPKLLRPILLDWWERAGRPERGPLFPTRRGDRAGKTKKKTSHAKAFRRDLRRAFGIDVPVPVTTLRKNGRPLTQYDWREARAPTPRERELFEETDYTRPVDFHSWRRSLAQALIRAGVSTELAKRAGGWQTDRLVSHYGRDGGSAHVLPENALPVFSANKQLVNPLDNCFDDLGWAGQVSNLRHPACKAQESDESGRNQAGSSETTLGEFRPFPASSDDRGLSLPALCFGAQAERELSAILRLRADALASDGASGGV